MLRADSHAHGLIPATKIAARSDLGVICHMNDSLRVEAEAAPVLDVAALLGGDSPALLLHYHITLLK